MQERKSFQLFTIQSFFKVFINTEFPSCSKSHIEKTIKLSHGWFISQNWWPTLTQIFSGNFAKLVWLDWIKLNCQTVDQDIIIIWPRLIIKTGNWDSIIVKCMKLHRIICHSQNLDNFWLTPIITALYDICISLMYLTHLLQLYSIKPNVSKTRGWLY